MKIKLSLFIVLFTIVSCSFYSAGNIGSVCDIETPLELETIQQLSDTLFKEGKYDVPENLREILNIDDYNFLNYKIYYFDSEPRKIYMVTFNGDLSVRMIYDVGAKVWKSQETNWNENEIEKIKTRFQTTVLKDIEQKAKDLGFVDSVIYFNKKNK